MAASSRVDQIPDKGPAPGASVASTERSEARSAGASAAAKPPPWYKAGSVTRGVLGPLDEASRARRRTRFDRRQRSSEWLIRDARVRAGEPAVAPTRLRADQPGWVKPPRPARCRWRIAGGVGLHGDKGRAHFSGTERCASIWACPCCSAVIRAERATHIQAAAAGWQAQGGSLVFVTLTVRHRDGDPLKGSLDAVMKSWRRLLMGKSWKTFRERFGVRGYIRAVEVTRGRNGWHPHIHVLFFTDRPLTSTDALEWESLMYGRWADYVVKHGARLPTQLRGIDVRAADADGTVVAQYLAKVQEKDADSRRIGVGQELARFDFKGGRLTSLTPFELLDFPGDDAPAQQAWAEYVDATWGRRAITWSKGLREMCQVSADIEVTDEEIVADTEDAPLRFWIPAKLYDATVRNDPTLMARLLELIELDRADEVPDLLPGIVPADQLGPHRGGIPIAEQRAG